MLKVIFFAVFCWIVSVRTQNQDCYDASSTLTCYSFYQTGLCQKSEYFVFMYERCRRSCQLCPTPTTTTTTTTRPTVMACTDNRSNCAKWRQHCPTGSRYFEFMNKNCRRTCMMCSDDNCNDLHKNCEVYENYGYCNAEHKYFRFMKKNCASTCRLCRQKTEPTAMAPKSLINRRKERLCTFEVDECDWFNEQFEDNGQWIVGIMNGGPEQGFGDSGNYLFLDSLYEGYTGQLWLPWQLILNDSADRRRSMCMHFQCQMTGGTISVVEKETPSVANKLPSPHVAFTSNGQFYEWTHLTVTVEVTAKKDLKLIGTKGRQGTYIAIDNVYFVKGECS